MSPLVTYYVFLVISAVLMVAWHRSHVVPERRNFQLTYLFVPPFALVASSLQRSFSVSLLLILGTMLVMDRLLRRYAKANVTESTFGLWISLWLGEAMVPLGAHFILRSQPDLERWLLVILALFLSVIAFLIFMVWAPDLRKQT